PRGGAPSRFFLDERAAASRAVVYGGRVSVLGQWREVRGEKEVSCDTHESARETGDRRLSCHGCAEAGVLRADAARRRQPGATAAQCFAAAARTGRGAAARRNPGTGARSEERRVGKECRARWSP